MLNSSEEYEKISSVENEHWWYSNLHHLTLKEVHTHFPNKNISILDTGCGTGGCIQFLNAKGYANIKGVDISEHAINICKSKSISVAQCDIKNIGSQFSQNTFDAIVCHDVLYFLDELEIKKVLDDFYSLLKVGGIILINIPANNAFRGIHDISVGINKRFTKAGFKKLISKENYQIKQFYWPFFLSPIIFAKRLLQRMKLSLNSKTKIKSDISLPPKWLNSLLLKVSLFERKIISNPPWGSSLFIVLKKK